MDLTVFLGKISIWAIPLMSAVTLHEVGHGWMAHRLGDRSAELLRRLSPNPLRHIDPLGTVLVPALLLLLAGSPLFGWGKRMPDVVREMPHPRAAAVLVALAGPAANLIMAAAWCAVLRVATHVHGNETLIGWVAYMAQAGIWINVVLAVLNVLPVPPLDGARVVAVWLPSIWSARVEKAGFLGLGLLIGLSLSNVLGWLFEPTYRVISRVINVLFGSPA